MALMLAALVLSAILIYFSCELFVNGIEWVGLRFNISKNAVGTVLAAFSTALPESVVTFIAVVFGANASQKDVIALFSLTQHPLHYMDMPQNV
ncbi:hypothetical protein Desde_1934 [Desulfitobacterium dehalogenans ATCC 51507]|uniref:Sodium/calcium exchanger membrane region domain-containing protein n=1 Tax=Desulfitobacterium dehalogenans (strain ATCC 51507 / DSM 9161 / JW/IU-DC1) TaxID=756499 RepID=I4A8N8_DESDJ|nr:hypothetical protein [Desulfitobacterium dehalogenans]AFM00323.1 hypothetical protein Desde_1934 [Desulfitobacterium dehalogenans ATCC 51507]